MSTFTMKSRPVFITVLLIIVSLLIAGGVWIGIRLVFPDKVAGLAGVRPSNLGVHSGQLLPCPNTPNCVSSQSQDAEHSIEPLTYKSTPREALATLKRVIESQPRTKIIAETQNYIYAEFSSAIMGFVDDVEFSIDEGAGVINVRSGSRLGESDLGVNRQRIENIRSLLSNARF